MTRLHPPQPEPTIGQERAAEAPQSKPSPVPPLVAGQEGGYSHLHEGTVTSDTAPLPSTEQPTPHKTASFRRKFANRVWTSPAYKQARQQEKFDPPQVLLLDTSGPLGVRCKALADPEAIPFLEPSPQPSEQESRLNVAMPLVSIDHSRHSRPASSRAKQGDSYLHYAGHQSLCSNRDTHSA